MTIFESAWLRKTCAVLALGVAAMAASAGASRADDPTGNWLVADRTAQMKAGTLRRRLLREHRLGEEAGQ